MKDIPLSQQRKEFGQRLRRCINDNWEYDYTAAEAIGIPPETLSRYINGARYPKFAHLLSILKALPSSIDVRWLITGEPTKP